MNPRTALLLFVALLALTASSPAQTPSRTVQAAGKPGEPWKDHPTRTLLDSMKRINERAYGLVDYFDKAKRDASP